MTKHPISRRTMLRGLGVSVALPLLDVMLPRFASSAMAAAAAKAPVRTAYLFLPNGMWMPNFTPTTIGANFALPASLAPLANVAKDFSIISGLGLDAARAHGDGPRDHARSAAAYLTGVHSKKTRGSATHLCVSVDQVAAMKIGSQTRLPS